MLGRDMRALTTVILIVATPACSSESASQLRSADDRRPDKPNTPDTPPAGVTCGDGSRAPGERCDGSDLDGATCTSLGYAAGPLRCDSTCSFDVSACTGSLPVPTGPMLGDLSARVMIVVNGLDADSIEVGAYYRAARGIPMANVCTLQTLSGEHDFDWVEFDELEAKVRKPIRRCLVDNGLVDQVWFIAMTYNLPTSVWNGPDQGDYEFWGNSVDSYVFDPFDTQPSNCCSGNTYEDVHASMSRERIYGGPQSIGYFRQQNPDDDIYLVSRLDAPTKQLALGLVDKAIASDFQGPPAGAIAYIDSEDLHPELNGEDELENKAEYDLFSAASFLQEAGIETVLDKNLATFGTAPALLACPNTYIYLGWYNIDPYNDAFAFMPGAIAMDINSAATWDYRNARQWATEAVRRGVTATLGPSAEPRLAGITQTDIFARSLLHGYTFAEAAYAATRGNKWQMMMVGDPIYRPLKTPLLVSP